MPAARECYVMYAPRREAGRVVWEAHSEVGRGLGRPIEILCEVKPRTCSLQPFTHTSGLEIHDEIKSDKLEYSAMLKLVPGVGRHPKMAPRKVRERRR